LSQLRRKQVDYSIIDLVADAIIFSDNAFMYQTFALYVFPDLMGKHLTLLPECTKKNRWKIGHAT
jgi:hypothetical protein